VVLEQEFVDGVPDVNHSMAVSRCDKPPVAAESKEMAGGTALGEELEQQRSTADIQRRTLSSREV